MSFQMAITEKENNRIVTIFQLLITTVLSCPKKGISILKEEISSIVTDRGRLVSFQ